MISAPAVDAPFSLVLGMTYTYLPFVVLPLYGQPGQDGPAPARSRPADLGPRHWKGFLAVTVPLSKAGIIAGSFMLVFIPLRRRVRDPRTAGRARTR